MNFREISIEIRQINSLSGLYLFYLKTIDHLEMKLLYFEAYSEFLRYVFPKIQDWGHCELSPK